jgi:transcription antitermination protein NusB
VNGPAGAWPEDAAEHVTDGRHRSQRDGRRLCLEALFESDFGQRTARDVLERRIGESAADEVAAAHARILVDAVVQDRVGIDTAIERAAPQWPVVTLARIDRSLLRSAMGELLHCPATPTAVAISEWVELARSYSGESARKLLNGVLGRVAREAGRQPRPGTAAGGGHDKSSDDQEEPPT